MKNKLRNSQECCVFCNLPLKGEPEHKLCLDAVIESGICIYPSINVVSEDAPDIEAEEFNRYEEYESDADLADGRSEAHVRQPKEKLE